MLHAVIVCWIMNRNCEKDRKLSDFLGKAVSNLELPVALSATAARAAAVWIVVFQR